MIFWTLFWKRGNDKKCAFLNNGIPVFFHTKKEAVDYKKEIQYSKKIKKNLGVDKTGVVLEYDRTK